MKPPEWTVREFAALERVVPRTVYRWADKGAITVRRTPGGRLRIAETRAPGPSSRTITPPES
jgi:predicted site-specific integrase-resolvase